MNNVPGRRALIAAARAAAAHAYAPYSRLAVGAALAFADGRVVTAANVENASYGLSLCAETNAVARAMADGIRGGLMAVAVVSGTGAMLRPCGRCRQILSELALLGGTDPQVYGAVDGEDMDAALSQLLPFAFGPDSLDAVGGRVPWGLLGKQKATTPRPPPLKRRGSRSVMPLSEEEGE